MRTYYIFIDNSTEYDKIPFKIFHKDIISALLILSQRHQNYLIKSVIKTPRISYQISLMPVQEGIIYLVCNNNL